MISTGPKLHLENNLTHVMILTGPKLHLEKDPLMEGSLFLESSKFIVLISLFSVLLHYFYLRKPPMG